MTQSVTNTLNNIEQIFTTQTNVVKSAENTVSGMDKSADFNKVLDNTLNKTSEIKKTSDLDKTLENSSTNVNNSVEKLSKTDAQIISENKNDSFVESDIKGNVVDSEQSVNWSDFKGILNQIIEEANAETSLDLTLSKDIDEVVDQLKDATENISKIIDEVEDKEIINVLDTDVQEEIDVELEDQELVLDESKEEDSRTVEVKIPFEQVVGLIDKKNELLFEAETLKVKEETSNIVDVLETTQPEVVELSENLTDEVLVSKSTTGDVSRDDIDIPLDEDILKELNVESIKADVDTSENETLMQNQTPEEFAVKVMINQEIETFDVKVESVQNIQNAPQAQSKPVEVNPSRIVEQVAKHLEGLQSNSKVNIVLNPESLGKVNIQLLSTKEGLTAQFTVSTQEARDLLMKGLDGLKDSLVSHGVGVENVSIKVADSQKTEYNQDWTEQEGSRGGNKGQSQPNKEEKEKGLFEKMMAQTTEDENGNV